MKPKSFFNSIRWLMLLVTIFAPVLASHAQGTTSFTYQGQLRDNGTNANGVYSLSFKLYNQSINGTQVGSTLNSTETPITNGLFTVFLDFGEVFNGSARWLDITVNTNWFLPRQLLTPTPYALYAPKAGQAGTVTNGAVQNPTFIGNTGVTPLQFSVNNELVFRIQPQVRWVTNDNGGVLTSFNSTFINTISGFSGNTISNGVLGGTIAGGGGAEVDEALDHIYSPNIVAAHFGTIGGGARNKVSGVAGTVAGGFSNLAADVGAGVLSGVKNQANAPGAIIGGGVENLISGEDSFIGAGEENQITNDDSAIVAGDLNAISGNGSFIGAGSENTVSGGQSAVVSGHNNTASGQNSFGGGGAWCVAGGANSFVGGGQSNRATGDFSVAVGGNNNIASGNFSIALGANARATHGGSFVWASSSADTFSSSADGEFAISASGGCRFVCGPSFLKLAGPGVSLNCQLTSTAVGGASFAGTVSAPTFTTSSDRNAKHEFTAVDAQSVLAKVSALPIQTWTFKQDATGTRHIGAMAQDFHAAFGVGSDEKHIATVDADGVALAAIQGLNQLVKEKDAQINELKQRLEALEKAVSTLAKSNK